MQTSTYIYVLVAFLSSVSIAWFLYFYKVKEHNNRLYLLFSLRTLGVFMLLLLLINPSIEKNEIKNHKPVLSVLIDNSLSIKRFKSEDLIKTVVNELKQNSKLHDMFELQFYKFGETTNLLDSLSFNENQTNIYKAINDVYKLQSAQVMPIVLLTDGNQTVGNSYAYYTTQKNIFPLIIGDTHIKDDIKITQLNVNKYSYLNNKFPVEIRVLYDGKQNVKTKLSITQKGRTLFTKNLSFNKNKSVQTITTYITSDKKGIRYYKVSLSKLDKEENLENNSKEFSVEVLDEQTKILLLTSINHPDIGALKKSIEKNKQRSVTIKNVNNFKDNLLDYQLIIVYQPTERFETVFNKINQNHQNYFVVSGTQTNWNFLNEVQLNYYKNTNNQEEDYAAIYNNGFLTFGQSNIAFESFPPLKDKFGTLTINQKYDVLLYQNIGGISTKYPLLAFFENGNQKNATLFGEGIWKWRANSFLGTNSFQDFDAFIGNIIQYLASTKKRERLIITYDKLYTANKPITITAFYTDKNYQFDKRATLNLKLTKVTKNVTQNIPFSLANNSFQAVLEELPSGDYQFIVEVENQSITKSGQFRIANYQIEKQFSKANSNDLKLLASNTNGKAYHISNYQELIKELENQTNYKTIQTNTKQNQYLIDWKLILILAISFFTIEWFIRKYYGKI